MKIPYIESILDKIAKSTKGKESFVTKFEDKYNGSAGSLCQDMNLEDLLKDAKELGILNPPKSRFLIVTKIKEVIAANSVKDIYTSSDTVYKCTACGFVSNTYTSNSICPVCGIGKVFPTKDKLHVYTPEELSNMKNQLRVCDEDIVEFQKIVMNLDDIHKYAIPFTEKGILLSGFKRNEDCTYIVYNWESDTKCEIQFYVAMTRLDETFRRAEDSISKDSEVIKRDTVRLLSTATLNIYTGNLEPDNQEYVMSKVIPNIPDTEIDVFSGDYGKQIQPTIVTSAANNCVIFTLSNIKMHNRDGKFENNIFDMMRTVVKKFVVTNISYNYLRMNKKIEERKYQSTTRIIRDKNTTNNAKEREGTNVKIVYLDETHYIYTSDPLTISSVRKGKAYHVSWFPVRGWDCVRHYKNGKTIHVHVDNFAKGKDRLKHKNDKIVTEYRTKKERYDK